jgi:hypothetical protein
MTAASEARAKGLGVICAGSALTGGCGSNRELSEEDKIISLGALVACFAYNQSTEYTENIRYGPRIAPLNTPSLKSVGLIKRVE